MQQYEEHPQDAILYATRDAKHNANIAANRRNIPSGAEEVALNSELYSYLYSE
jgi:hypothetical protein